MEVWNKISLLSCIERPHSFSNCLYLSSIPSTQKAVFLLFKAQAVFSELFFHNLQTLAYKGISVLIHNKVSRPQFHDPLVPSPLVPHANVYLWEEAATFCLLGRHGSLPSVVTLSKFNHASAFFIRQQALGHVKL